MTAQSNQPSASPQQSVALLCRMLRIRRFEEKAAELYSLNKMRGFLPLYIGNGIKTTDEEGNVDNATKTRDILIRSGGGVALGAIIGAISKGGKGAAIGAIIGAGVGAAWQT